MALNFILPKYINVRVYFGNIYISLKYKHGSFPLSADKLPLKLQQQNIQQYFLKITHQLINYRLKNNNNNKILSSIF